MFRFHVLFLSILPLILNILINPTLIIFAVSLPEFLENSTYYIYTYGLVLWSVYHVFLAWLAFRFFKAEKQRVKEIIGRLGNMFWGTIFIVVVLLGLSVLLFQIIEPPMTDLIYGSGAWKQFLRDYKRIPLALAVYGIAVTSLTAGICEEIVWRGYLQTRFELLLHGKVLAAILLQAVLFGFWHSISVHTLFTAVFGFIYGMVYAKTRKLVPIMISHWLGDVIGFSTMYFM
ncbi:MAG: CPBP family intramembrane glutamic endopeptidase [Candidatus Bathyarchaeia archaeon]